MVDQRRRRVKNRGHLAPDCRHERGDSEDLHRAFHVVGEYVQTHLGTDAWDRLGQEVSCSHPGFDRAKRMLGGLAAYSWGLRAAIQSALHFIEDILVLPTCDAPIVAGRTFRFDCASRAGGRPILVERQSMLERGEAPDRSLACGTAVLILGRDVAKIRFVEQPDRPVAGGM